MNSVAMIPPCSRYTLQTYPAYQPCPGRYQPFRLFARYAHRQQGTGRTLFRKLTQAQCLGTSGALSPACFLTCLAAFFSLGVIAGCFLPSLLLCLTLPMDPAPREHSHMRVCSQYRLAIDGMPCSWPGAHKHAGSLSQHKKTRLVAGLRIDGNFPSKAFKHRRDTLTTTYTHRHQRIAPIGAL